MPVASVLLCVFFCVLWPMGILIQLFNMHTLTLGVGLSFLSSATKIKLQQAREESAGASSLAKKNLKCEESRKMAAAKLELVTGSKNF